MNVKITRGGYMRGAVEYLAANKEGIQRDNPRVVAGLGRDGQPLDERTIAGITSDLDDPRRLFGTEVTENGKPAHVWACALALNRDRDGVLTDERWRAISEDFMRRMDLGPGVRWVAVRHGVNAGGHDHVHIVAGLVGEDGRAANVRRDWVRASKAANAVEHKHGLVVNESRELGVSARGVSRPALERAERLGRESETDYLARVVRASAIEARNEREFVRLVREHGVQVTPRMAKGSQTHVAGYSYGVPESARYGGGRLARDLTLPRLRQRWAGTAPDTADEAAHRAAGRLAAYSLRSERIPGPAARESSALGRFAQTRVAGGLVLTAAMAAVLRERIRAANRDAEREQERQYEARRPERSRDHGIGI